jgi:acetyl-CoA synthetase
MEPELIKNQSPDANLQSYSETYKKFSWSDLEPEFSWSQSGQINIVHEAIDRWAMDQSRGDQIALTVEKQGTLHQYTFRELMETSCAWANLLKEYGFEPGDRLFILLTPGPEVFLAMAACARLGVIFSNLYLTLSFDELDGLIKYARPKGIVTEPDLAELLPLDEKGPVKQVFLTEGPATGLPVPEVVVKERLDGLSRQFPTTWVERDWPLYLVFTSGSTGPPKGVVHAHKDMLGHLLTARYVLDLRPGSTLWTDANHAWVTGTVYSAFAPWLCGAASVVQAEPFSGSTWYRTLERLQVEVWYTTPATIRKLMEAGEDLPGRYDLSSLRHICTVGEPLGPELFRWVRKSLKHNPHDTWWMSETGMICIANFPSVDIKAGSMGKPVPGVKALVLDEEGKPLPLLSMGELALKADWPAMAVGLWEDEGRYQEYFRHQGIFLTGDMVVRDEDGYFFYQGRIDDLIKAGDKLIGPFEVENVLTRHPAVAEAAVISKAGNRGKPALKAFIILNLGQTPSTRLKQEIMAFVKANLAPDIPFTQVEFMDSLPRTKSGKLLRRVLRAKELGLPSGDPAMLHD